MTTPGNHLREVLQRAHVVVLFLLISAVFLRLIWGFVVAVVMAAIFAALAYPLYTRMLKIVRGRSAVAAALTLAVVVLLVLAPLAAIVQLVGTQAVEISQSVKPQVSAVIQQLEASDSSLDWLPFWDRLEPYRDQIMTKLGEIASAISSFLVSGLSAAAQGTVRFLFDLFIVLYSMFFFLMHGPEVRDQVLRLFPLKESDKELLLGKFVSVSRATIKGTLVIGVVQGGLAGAAFAVVGLTGAAFWGTVMAVLSIIPGIGTALVWVPAVIYLFIVGETVSAIGLLLWCAIVVGTADNVLRPLLVGKDTEMPDILVLLSTFGGLALFGAVGLVIGPVIAALFLAMWKIYNDTFGELLSAPSGAAEEG